jgi:dihydroorotate dehydrogenase
VYRALRPLIFRLDPERAHSLTINLLRLAGSLPPVTRLLGALFQAPDQPCVVCGLHFRNPIGLAAGYDKDGLAWRGLAALGFGHLELGTVTPRPQPGNPRPRLFRIPQEEALINRLGFPGQGADFLAGRLQGGHPPGLVLGVNLGKNKDTPLEEAAQDYLALLERFASAADYLAINVSSPNTVGLRRLQARSQLESLLQALHAARQSRQQDLDKQLPLLVKLAPDLEEAELEDALQAITGSGMDGVIATNTTIRRDSLRSALGSEAGGLSGAPLEALSTQMVAKIHQLAPGLPIVGVGGVSDAASARRKLEAGASLVQLYTGLVYAGPGLVKQILEGLAQAR